MSAAERRNVARTKLNKLAYIHIEPNNGGIVLNVSESGLGFHSMAPVERNGPVRFALKEQNRRIDVCGELIWTDEIQKIGGVRFTSLTSEAREQIDLWAAQHETLDEEPRGSTLGAAFLRAFPGLSVRRFVPKFDSKDRLASVAHLRTKLRLRMSGFSGGLATGLLISMLTGFIFLFSYAHRQQFGESLIHMGERLAGKSRPAPQPAASQAATNPLPMKTNVAQVASRTSVHAPASVPSQARGREAPGERVVHTQAPVVAKVSNQRPPSTAEKTALKSPPPRVTQQPVLHAAIHTTAAPAAQHVPPPNTAEVASSSAPLSSAPLSPASPAKPASDSGNASVPREPIGQVHAQSFAAGPALPLQMFFDLGKFKQQQLAQELSDRVAQLGIRASIVPKGHLWMNSYQVLAGPYMTVDEEKKIHSDLVSSGIKARPFERGSRGFAFQSSLTVGGSKLPVGDFRISWETYVTEAKVEFEQAGAVLATSNGKWIARPQKFAHNEYVYQNLGNNSRPLLEVHFAGLDRALVFR